MSNPVSFLRNHVQRLLGQPLPVALRHEFTQDLGQYFLPFLVGGAVAASLGIGVAAMVGSSVALALSVVALNGFMLVVLACWRARQPLPPEMLDRMEARYGLGILLASAGLGGMVFTVMAMGADFHLQTILAMVAIAALGVGNGSGPGRPAAALVQVVALGSPTALGVLLYWPAPVNFIGFGGISVYAVACMALALRSYNTLTASLLAREEQRSERLRTLAAIQHLNQPMVMLNDRLEVTLINPSALALLGLDADLPPLASFPMVLTQARNLAKASGDPDEFLNHAALLVAARQAFNGVLRLNDNRIIDLECIPVPDAGWVAILRDTTGERNAIAELNRELRRCPLTGLPNRRAFGEELERRLARTNRLSLLLVDLDAFKLVNERHGHAIGDRMITRIGFRLRTADPRLVVARMASDEFALLLPDASPEETLALAQSLLTIIDTPAHFGEAQVSVGAAIGIAMVPDHALLPDSLMHAADLALVSAKGQPGNQIRVYDPDMAEAAARNANLESRVRAAIRARQIDVAFQPMLDLATGRVVAVEALARMPDGGSGGVIDPAAMVAIAEDRGMIGELRRLVLQQAAATIAALPNELALWVNVSVSDLQRAETVDEILADVAAARVDCTRIALEITETMLMTDTAATLANMERLTGMGMGVAMDDFGSGFSSLERLGRLPINAVKISGGLLTGATANPVQASIFRAAASICHSMGVLLVAEGVEGPAELALARAAGVARVQGYLLSQPVAAADLPAAIAAAEAIAARSAVAA